MLVVDCLVSPSLVVVSLVVRCRLSCRLGCRLLVVDCLVALFVVSSWLSDVGCRVLVVYCLVSLSLVVVSSWLSNVGCWLWMPGVTVVGCC